MRIESVQTDQGKKFPVSNGPNSAPFFFRYGIDRSRDSQKSGQSGQDCISVEWTENRLAAALCDGVSQSFFGELASAELSIRLSRSLLTLPIESDPSTLHDKLQEHLDHLSATFSDTVEQYSLEHIQLPVLRAVLEKKRDLGSETVFTAVLLDKETESALLVWAGDCRLRLWLRGEEVTWALLRMEDFLTQERWSSKRGVVGNLHTVLIPSPSFDTIVCYSDGLSLMDNKPSIPQESNVAIEHYVSQTKAMASSDDVSFFQISTLPGEQMQTGLVSQLPKLHVRQLEASGYVQLQWSDNSTVQNWEVVANSETGFAKLETSKNNIKVLINEISPDGVWLAYRGKTIAGFTPWSAWKFYQPPMPIGQTETEEGVQYTGQHTSQPAQVSYPPHAPSTPTPSKSPTPPPNSPPHETTYRHTPQPQIPQAPFQAKLSDRKWQFALLALLLGIVVMGSFLIFGGQGEDREPTPPVRRTTPILTNPTAIPLSVDSSATLETPIIVTTAADESLTPSSTVDTPTPTPATIIVDPLAPADTQTTATTQVTETLTPSATLDRDYLPRDD